MEKEGIRANDLAKKIKRSYATTERYLSILRKIGIVTFEGAPKTGGYVLTSKVKQRLESKG